MVIFGGSSSTCGLASGAMNDVWRLTNANGSGGTPVWSPVTTAGGPPLGRRLPTTAYNSTSNRMIIFGGDQQPCGNATQKLNDVWVLTNANGNGGTATWTQLFPTGGPPAARSDNAYAYDPVNNRLTIFAGYSGSSALSDMWVLTHADGTGGTPNWSPLTPTGGPPSATSTSASVYDQATNRMILFGGFICCNLSPAPIYNDTWILTNANGLSTPQWIQLNPSGTLPAKRAGASAAYISATNQLVIFGGAVEDIAGNGAHNGFTPQANDTWVLSNANGTGGTPQWQQLTESNPPSTRGGSTSQSAAVFDASSARMMIFGGFHFTGAGAGTPLNDTWVFTRGSPVTVTTNPSGLNVLVQSVSHPAPYTFLCAAGASSTIGVTTPQAGASNQQYAFSQWNDSSVSLSRSIACPASATTYTASFSTQDKVNFATSPTGLTINLDSSPFFAPFYQFLSLGSHTVSVSSPQPGSPGVQYLYTGWSDGGAQTHSFDAASNIGNTLTANFGTTQYLLTTSVNPPGTGTISPASGYYNSGSVLSLQATAATNAPFAFWSGDLSGSANPQNLTMNAPHNVTANFCSYGLSLSNVSIPASGVTGNTVGVTASPNTCGWATVTSVGWVAVTDPAPPGFKTGSANLTYNVSANGANAPRSTTVSVGPTSLPFTINQAGQGCLFGLTPASAALGSGGGSGNVTVGLSGSDCAWTAVSNAPSWLTVTGGSGGPNGTLSYTAGSNSSSISRTGTITLTTAVSQTTFTVSQAGAAPCVYTLTQASQAFTSAGGGGSVTISTAAGCAWTTSNSGAPFVTITSGNSGIGSATVNYSVPPLSTPPGRTGSLTIAGKSYLVTQDAPAQGASCNVTVATPPQVAIEGRTEVMGDLVLNCSNLASAVTADILVTLNTNVTNALSGSPAVTDALLINGSTPMNGRLSGYSGIHWPGVTLGPGSTSVTIKNVRADASLLVVGSQLQSVPVTATVSVTTIVPVVVTYANQGANCGGPIGSGLEMMACAAPSLVFQKNPNPASCPAQTILPVFYQEAAAPSFHAAGGSLPATRLRLVLNSVPGTVQVYAPVYPNEGTTKAQLYSADSSGLGGSPVTGSPIAGGTYQQLTVSGGRTTATWVVLAADPSVKETWTFPLLVANPSTCSDVSGILMNATLAPVSDVGVASLTAPVPRYRDFATPQKVVNLRIKTSVTGLGSSATLTSKSLRKDASLAPRMATPVGSDVTTDVSSTNDTSDQSADNSTVTYYMSSGEDFQGCSPSCDRSGNEVSRNCGSMAPGGTCELIVTTQPDPSLPDGTVINNTSNTTSDQVPSDLNTTTSGTSYVVSNVVAAPILAAPGNTAAGVSLTPTLSWNASARATSYEVHFGKSSPPPFLANTAQTSYTLSPVDGGTTYYWYVIAMNPGASSVRSDIWSLTTMNAQSYTISGRVTLAGSGTGLSGVTLALNGPQNGVFTTDGSGNYNTGGVRGNGTYAIAPSLAGYTFTPPSITLSNLNANATVNFTATAATGLRFYPLTPCRIADTRAFTGPPAPLGPPSFQKGTARSFPVLSSACNIPAGAVAYSLNITAVPTNGYLGYLTAWPTGQSLPVASTLNSWDGRIVANAAIIPAGTGGAISIYVSDAADVFFDINGYFAPPQTSGLQFYPVVPCRVADTRAFAGMTGPFGPPSMAKASSRSFPVLSSSCGIPSTALAYALNVTAVPTNGYLGYLTIWGTGQPFPVASTLNSWNGAITANAAIVPAGTSGAISVYVSDPTDVFLDINGYFAPPGSGLSYYPLTPCRLADTRGFAGMTGDLGPPGIGAKASRSFPVAAAACGVPGTSGAYALNVTAVPLNNYLGYLTIWGTGKPFPIASTLNSWTGTIMPNMALVPAGNSGALSVYVSDPTDVFLDINGYFGP